MKIQNTQICACVCVCVCVRERESVRVYMCICMRGSVWMSVRAYFFAIFEKKNRHDPEE